MVVQRQAGAQRPFLPPAIAGGAGEQAAISDDEQAGGELQAGVEVDFQPGLGFSPAASKGSTSAARSLGSAGSLPAVLCIGRLGSSCEYIARAVTPA
jgi:hypothetical protein